MASRIRAGDLERLAQSREGALLRVPGAASASASTTHLRHFLTSASTPLPVPPTPGTHEALWAPPLPDSNADAKRVDSAPRLPPPAKRARGAGAASASAATPRRSSMWHYLNVRSAAMLPLSPGAASGDSAH